VYKIVATAEARDVEMLESSGHGSESFHRSAQRLRHNSKSLSRSVAALSCSLLLLFAALSTSVLAQSDDDDASAKVPFSKLAVAPKTINFNVNLAKKTSQTEHFVLTNVGTEPVNVTVGAPGGADPELYTISAFGIAASGGTITIPGKVKKSTANVVDVDVTFTPPEAGKKLNATVAISNDATRGPQAAVVNLHGTATHKLASTPATPTPIATEIPTGTPTPTATAASTATPTPTATSTTTATPTAAPTCGTGFRQVNLVNECDYTVWVGSAGGAVSCDQGTTCVGQNGSTQACANTSKSGDVPAYQCVCAVNADCPNAGDSCSKTGYCFKGLPPFSQGSAELKAPGSGQNSALLCLAAPTPAPTSTAVQTIQWSGTIFGRSGCPNLKFENGCAGGGETCPVSEVGSNSPTCCNGSCQCTNSQQGQCVAAACSGVPACATGDCDASITCPAGVGGSPPATQFEATLDSPGNPSDWYDITVINGINIPMAAVPIPGTYTMPGSSPYECGSPGAANPSAGLQGCSWQIPAPAATSTPPWPVTTSMRYLPPTTTTNAPCNVDSDCASGQICGLAFTPVAGATGNLERVCGYQDGFWSPVTLCAQNGALGSISGAFQCSTPLCNAAPSDPNFPSAKMPAAGCPEGQVNFPVITCSTNSDCNRDNQANSMVCDLTNGSTGYCVPMVSTKLCPATAYADAASGLCLEGADNTPVTCTDDAACSSGFTCTGVTGQSSTVCAIAGECNSNFDCPLSLPYSCSNGNNQSTPPPAPTPTATSGSPTPTASPGEPTPTPGAPTATPTPTPMPGQCVPNLWSIYAATAFAPASFYNGGTTNGQLATGYEPWVVNGEPLPYPIGEPTPALPANPNWTTHALPFESALKTACPTAYSYQYDDPYSLFTCSSASESNQTGYTLTFCPAGSPTSVLGLIP
jgi:hypothetical protein